MLIYGPRVQKTAAQKAVAVGEGRWSASRKGEGAHYLA
ncbi:MAG: hypothetical protein OJF50_005060 [Nitrospira sp.]|nr:hypothetical protein [Nitrospira sp.]